MIRPLVSALTVVLSACTAYSHTNIRQPNTVSEQTRATFNVTTDRGRPDTLFILAFSGGGSRAAYWSASVMLRLQQVFASEGMNMRDEVDAISSVSGGSLPAAYYAISTDPGAPPLYGRTWDEQTVKRLMTRNYTGRWFGNWFWPTNIGKFWFTAYDRTDIMAQTLADNLYDTRPLGRDLKMRDLNRAVPTWSSMRPTAPAMRSANRLPLLRKISRASTRTSMTMSWPARSWAPRPFRPCSIT